MNFFHRLLIDRYLLAAACSIAIATMLVTPLRAQTQTELETEKTLVWKMLHQGDFAKARSLLSSLCDTARDSKESGLGQKSVFYLECLSLLGAIELRSGMLTEASGHLTEAKDGFARKRRSFKDDYRQAMVRGQVPAFMAYAGQITGHYCRDLDCLGEVKLEQQAFEEADSLFKESLKAREASIADGIAPNEPVPSGLTMSKHLQGLYCLRKGDLTHARHYLEAAVKEFEAFIAAKAEAAAEAASEHMEASFGELGPDELGIIDVEAPEGEPIACAPPDGVIVVQTAPEAFVFLAVAEVAEERVHILEADALRVDFDHRDPGAAIAAD
jgi:tetratricopeptide (TPR) repeat protein